MRFLLAVASLAALPVLVSAETAYVTDVLRLGLHEAEDASDRAFRTLRSGQEMEVVSRSGYYANVRLPDGTTGYVKAAYLVAQKPAILIVTETQAANAALETKMAEMDAAFAGPAMNITALQLEQRSQQLQLDEAATRIDELAQDNAVLKTQQKRYKYSLPFRWVGGALVVCLLAGFLGGLRWVDQRSRKRHGGVRIY